MGLGALEEEKYIAMSNQGTLSIAYGILIVMPFFGTVYLLGYDMLNMIILSIFILKAVLMYSESRAKEYIRYEKEIDAIIRDRKILNKRTVTSTVKKSQYLYMCDAIEYKHLGYIEALEFKMKKAKETLTFLVFVDNMSDNDRIKEVKAAISDIKYSIEE